MWFLIAFVSINLINLVVATYINFGATILSSVLGALIPVAVAKQLEII